MALAGCLELEWSELGSSPWECCAPETILAGGLKLDQFWVVGSPWEPCTPGSVGRTAVAGAGAGRPERAPCSFGRSSRISKWIFFPVKSKCPLNCCFLLCRRVGESSLRPLSYISPNCRSLWQGWRSHGCGVSILPTLCAVASCSVISPVFCRRNCSICWCRISVSLGGGELRVFVHC